MRINLPSHDILYPPETFSIQGKKVQKKFALYQDRTSWEHYAVYHIPSGVSVLIWDRDRYLRYIECYTPIFVTSPLYRFKFSKQTIRRIVNELRFIHSLFPQSAQQAYLWGIGQDPKFHETEESRKLKKACYHLICKNVVKQLQKTK